MKCLRCGREIGNKLECDCGHFYENNLSGNNIKYHNNKNNEKVDNKVNNLDNGEIKIWKIIKYYLYAVILISFIGCTYLITNLIININGNNSQEKEDYSKYCSIKCEGNSFSIKGDYCICESGMKYIIEEK